MATPNRANMRRFTADGSPATASRPMTGSLGASKGGLAPSRPGTSASAAAGSSRRPGTAEDAASMFLTIKTKRTRTFLKDAEESGTTLPQPLPPGIPYVANFTTFEDLLQRNLLQVPEDEQVHLTAQDVRILYEAKCLDQNLKPSWNREVRFMELLSASCKGQTMSLQENGLSHTSAEAVAHVLTANDYYSVLDLSGNRLKDVGARAIADLLERNDNLVHVSLSSNDIGHVGGAALARVLETNNTVTSVDLGGVSGVNRNHLGVAGAKALGTMLKRNRTLHSLSLSCNGIAGEGVTELAEGLAQNSTLRLLNLSSNNIGPRGCVALSEILELTKITRLDLQRNNIGDVGCIKLAEALTSRTVAEHLLEDLKLDHNEIGAEGLEALGQVLKQSTSLKKLTLSGNNFGGSGSGEGVNSVVGPFAAELHNAQIEELSLASCGIREKDAVLIANGLALNKKLQKFDFSNNRGGDAGAKAFGEMLKTNEKLIVLNLSTNHITTVGAHGIVRCFKANKVLRDLNLRHNTIDNAGGELIEDELRYNNSIQKLDVEFNDFTYKALQGIRHTLERNAKTWGAGAVPRLNAHIAQLDSKQKELYHTQAEIDSMAEQIKAAHDKFLSRNDQNRQHSEKNKKENDALREQVLIEEGIMEEARDHYDRERVHFNEIESKMKRELDRLNDKKTREAEMVNKIQISMRKLAERFQNDLKAEEEALRPVNSEFERAEFEMDSARSDAKYQSECLSNLSLKIKQLELSLGLAKPEPAPTAAGSGAKGARTQKAAASPTKTPAKKKK